MRWLLQKKINMFSLNWLREKFADFLQIVLLRLGNLEILSIKIGLSEKPEGKCSWGSDQQFAVRHKIRVATRTAVERDEVVKECIRRHLGVFRQEEQEHVKKTNGVISLS